jgi:hypothetical protein
MARAKAAPVEPVARVGRPAAPPPAADVPKIAIGVAGAESAAHGRAARATRTVAASDASATAKSSRRGSPAASATPPAAAVAAPAARKPPVAARPTSPPPTEPAPQRSMEQVDPAGGRTPQRPILTRNPYEAQ